MTDTTKPSPIWKRIALFVGFLVAYGAIITLMRMAKYHQ